MLIGISNDYLLAPNLLFIALIRKLARGLAASSTAITQVCTASRQYRDERYIKYLRVINK